MNNDPATEAVALKEALLALVRVALVIPLKLRRGDISATEAAVASLRHLAPKASGAAIHQALAEVVGALMTEMGAPAFMEANGGQD
jgi:hypothetical protein